jgi:hypothetical protein
MPVGTHSNDAGLLARGTGDPSEDAKERGALIATVRHPAPAARSIEPLAPGRFKVQFTAGAELREKLERLRALLRPQVPDGDLARVLERAVTEAIDRLEVRRFGRTKRPRAAAVPMPSQDSRYVPAGVRRLVAERNGLQCGFVARSGRRCSERADLEYHHRHPWALGGGHDPANIGLLCRGHNAWLAERDYGPRRKPPSAYRREGSCVQHAIDRLQPGQGPDPAGGSEPAHSCVRGRSATTGDDPG